jgi:hypothetical protein
VFVLGQATKISILNACAPWSHESAFSTEQQLFPQHFTKKVICEVVALNAGVMRRFQRVVALPDPKVIEFPQPQQHFH